MGVDKKSNFSEIDILIEDLKSQGIGEEDISQTIQDMFSLDKKYVDNLIKDWDNKMNKESSFNITADKAYRDMSPAQQKKVEEIKKSLVKNPEFKPKDGKTKEESAWTVAVSEVQEMGDLRSKKSGYLSTDELNKMPDLKEWLNNIMENYNEEVDTNLKSQIYDIKSNPEINEKYNINWNQVERNFGSERTSFYDNIDSVEELFEGVFYNAIDGKGIESKLEMGNLRGKSSIKSRLAMLKKKALNPTPPKPTSNPGAGMKWVLNKEKTGWMAVPSNMETFEIEKETSLEDALDKCINKELTKNEIGKYFDVLKSKGFIKELPLSKSFRAMANLELNNKREIYYTASLNGIKHLINYADNHIKKAYINGIDFKIEGNDLIITADENAKREILEYIADGSYDVNTDDSFLDAVEYVWTNGMFNATGMVGITSSIIFADTPVNDDGETFPENTKFYGYPAHQVKAPLQDLLDDGKVVFTTED